MEEIPEEEAISLVKTERTRRPSINTNDNLKHYNDILSFLTFGGDSIAGTSRQNVEALRKEASTFRVIGGVLYKGSRNPKRVITDTHERHGIISHFHLDHISGLHKSVDETVSDIQQQFFWKGILSETREFVKNCQDCQAVPHPSSSAWSQLELVTHGPFSVENCSQTEYVVTLSDLASKYVLAKCVPSDQDLAEQVSKFLFSSMCQLGFTKCCHVCSNESLHQSFLRHFHQLYQHLDQSSHPLIASDFITRSNNPSEFNNFLTESLNVFISSHFSTWPQLIDVWLFRQRTNTGSFHTLLNRAPFNTYPNSIKELSSAKRRRPLKSCFLHCRHCGQVFTSKVSFKLHQNRHLEEARQEGTEFGQVLDSTTHDEDEAQNEATEEEKDALSDPNTVAVVTQNTISAVQILMSETKEMRSKRGKYFKYSPELKEEIAEFAEKHGSLEAANHYSKTLGNPLSESTIRNFVKTRMIFSDETKEEIGKNAAEFGLEACLKMYSAKLPSLNRPIIKRFKDFFMKKNPDLGNEEGADNDEGDDNNDDTDDDTGDLQTVQKFVFDPSLKSEIGRYALHCGNANAVLHFSKKLRFPIKETTVRMFKKAFTDNNQVEVIDTENPTDAAQDNGVPLPLTVNHKNPKVRLKRRTQQKTPKANPSEPHRSRSKRGQYSTYSPQLRTQIAKYASNHGNQESIQYFKETLGIEVPESTVRGLRDKFLRLKKKENSDQMNLGPRGRPKRLGKYDEIVQKCIREIVDNGEKPTAFLAIVTAKQVLSENEPELLTENGGQIELNTTWAKSFLRRMNLGT